MIQKLNRTGSQCSSKVSTRLDSLHSMDASQCRNDLRHFGLPAFTPDTAGYNIIIKLNYIILYNILIDL